MGEKDFSLNIALENAEMRRERTTKRFIVAIVLIIVMGLLNNVAWLYAWMQFEYVGEEVSIDGTDGIATYMGGGGVINNGENNNP